MTIHKSLWADTQGRAALELAVERQEDGTLILTTRFLGTLAPLGAMSGVLGAGIRTEAVDLAASRVAARLGLTRAERQRQP